MERAVTSAIAPVVQLPLSKKLRLVVAEPQLMDASFANLGNTVVFTTIFSFLLLFVASLGAGDAELGAMLGGRALASTLARLPTGLLTMRWRSRSLMLVSLGLAATVLFAISRVTYPTILAALLMLDGVAYGMFLTAGQAHITNLSAETERGAAIGIYNTAGSVGGALGPVLLGIVAEWAGLSAVFRVASAVVVGSAITFLAMNRPGHESIRSEVAAR